MRIIKTNLNYKIPAWVSTCPDCESEFEFTLKDTQIHFTIGTTANLDSYSDKEYWIQCPVCGRWMHVLINRN